MGAKITLMPQFDPLKVNVLFVIFFSIKMMVKIGKCLTDSR